MAMLPSSNKKFEEFRMKLAYLKESVDPRYLVESLGIKIFRETPKELRGTCIIHGGDNPTSFRFNKERLTWVCFSHKCHEIHGNDVIGLIKATLKLDFKPAVEYLSRLVGDFDTDLGAIEYKRNKERDNFIKQSRKGNEEVYHKVNEEHLLRYRGLRTGFFLKQGYSVEALDYFEIGGGYKTADKLIREVIPIRDTNGKLVAYSLRDTRKKNVNYESKYLLTPGFDKDKVLYNLHNIIPAESRIIVVEGFKSVWRLWDYGIPNVVAVMGSEITQGQRNLLMTHALYGITIMFDNDVAGATGAVNAYNLLKDKMDVDVVFIQETDEEGKGLDPSDLDKDTVHDYLEGRIAC